jgi:hypothetical protein
MIRMILWGNYSSGMVLRFSADHFADYAASGGYSRGDFNGFAPDSYRWVCVSRSMTVFSIPRLLLVGGMRCEFT